MKRVGAHEAAIPAFIDETRTSIANRFSCPCFRVRDNRTIRKKRSKEILTLFRLKGLCLLRQLFPDSIGLLASFYRHSESGPS